MRKILYLFMFLLSNLVWAEDNKDDYAWVQFNSNGKLELRYITKNNDTCPKARIDNDLLQMQTRSKPDSNFPEHVCYVQLNEEVSSVEVNSKKINLSANKYNKVVIIGDTGCSEQRFDQKCLDSNSWPLNKIANTIKTKEKYDYIIHLGDYHYSPSDFSFSAWKQEFFSPLSAILNDKPWIMLRGNHENCKRGYEGWSKILDPFPIKNQCDKFSPLYNVVLGKYKFIVMDNTAAYDLYEWAKTPYEEAEMIKLYTLEFKKIRDEARLARENGSYPIVLMHKPSYGIDQYHGKERLFNITMAASSHPRYIDHVEMIISGHIHAWEALSLKDHRYPPQIVVGNSGNKLIPSSAGKFNEISEINKHTGLDIAKFYGGINFGYAVLSLLDHKTLIEFKNVDGDIVKTCVIKDRKLFCK